MMTATTDPLRVPARAPNLAGNYLPPTPATLRCRTWHQDKGCGASAGIHAKGMYNDNKFLVYERFILITDGELLLNRELSSSHERTTSARGPSAKQLLGDRCTSAVATQRRRP